MNITFGKAKNGDITAIYNNITLHSSYNPTREAERFVSTLNISYTTPLIVITEPCISYIVPLIKEKYPKTKIAIIRYTPYFNEYNTNSDYILNYYEHTNDFSNELYNAFGEELLLKAYFLQWEPSAKAFTDINNQVILSIKDSLEKAKTLLITREYFEKKWFLNSVNFIHYTNNLYNLSKTIDFPVLILSSGPSLAPNIKVIQENQNKYFIICLSSAVSVLLRNNIIPDICITTDGGFWAGQHLKQLRKYDIPLACPLEGYVQKELLTNKPIIPLGYNDGLSNLLVEHSNYPTLLAERNGTVSGTALCFALQNSSTEIYLSGIDMSNQRGYQHTQPNEIELNNSIKDNIISSKEKRITKSEYSTGVMYIYKQWFDTLNLNNRKVFRIIDKKYKHNNLGNIKDISSTDFYNATLNYTDVNKENLFTKVTFHKNEKDLLKFIENNINSDEWMEKMFPLSYTSLTHNPNNTDIINRLSKEKKNLLNKIGNILDD